jgi:O-antigen/teichoic acid export membrane protein
MPVLQSPRDLSALREARCRRAHRVLPESFPNLRIRLPGPHAPSWVLTESVAAAVFSLIAMLAIGRVIGPHATGLGMIAIAAFLALEMFSAVLFPDALVQLPGLARWHSDSAVAASVLLGAVLGAGLAAAAPLLAAGTGAPEVAWLVLALAPLVPISAFSGTVSGLLLREQRFRLLSLRLLLGQPLALGTGLILARSGYGPWAMVANQAVATAATFLVMLWGGWGRARFRLDLGALRDLWPVAGPQMAGVALNVGRYRIFLLALGLALPQALLAMSHFAFRLLEAALGVVWQAASRLAMPRLCALAHDREAMAETYGDVAELQALLGLPVCAGVALVAPELVAVLLGPDWSGTAEAARVVALASVATMLHGEQGSLFVALGKARRNVQVAVALLLVPLAALALLRPETPRDAALAWSAQCLLVPPVLASMVLRELRRPLGWLARRVAPAVIATAAMALAVLAVQGAVAAAPLPRLLASVLAGLVVYAVAAWLALGRRPPRALLSAAAGSAPSAAGGATPPGSGAASTRLVSNVG